MKKYLQTAKISWNNSFVYRLNFVMWRVRSFISLLVLYFLWLAITRNQTSTFGYTQAEMLTYIILGNSVVQALVFSSRSIDVQGEIARGDLNNYLIKPISYFGNWLTRDFTDKLLNVLFSFFELVLLLLIFRPPLFIQTNPLYLTTFILASFLAVILYFFFSLIVSFSTFWYPEQGGWPQRFFVLVLTQFISGRIFPLNILPRAAFRLLSFLPTSYLIFLPLQIYLGKLSPSQIFIALTQMVVWIFSLRLIVEFIWRKGLKIYGAYGR